jgi:hypothetical protein
MSPQYSTSGRMSRGGFVLGAPAAVPMADRPQIHQRGNQEPEQVDPADRQATVDQPCVDQRSERQEDEPQDQEQDAVEGPVQIMREQEQERYRDARKREDQDQE